MIKIFDILKYLITPTKYCEDCGSVLITKEFVDHYDKRTGRPVTFKTKVCSKDEKHKNYEW